MLKHSRCLVDNIENLRIEECYTICDGRQINIPEQIERIRKLARENRLFCYCGCGRNVTLYAGQAMLRRQHFRLKPSANDNKLCKAVGESDTTIFSKIVLKCWLDNLFQLSSGDVQCGVPIYAISDTNRRYEYTHYVDKYKLGLCYSRKSENLVDEKIQEMLQHSQQKIFYISDINNDWDPGQYPEYFMRVQKFQGFCMFLNVGNDCDFFNAKLQIVLYQKDFRGLWRELKVAHGKLSDFRLDNMCILYYRDESIIKMVEDILSCFQTEQEKEIEAIEKEKQRIAEEKAKEEARKEAERLQREKERQKKIEEQKEAERKRAEEYLSTHTEVDILFRFIKTLEQVGGIFQKVQTDGKTNGVKEHIFISKARFSYVKRCVEIVDEKNNTFYLYIIDAERDFLDKEKIYFPCAKFYSHRYRKEELLNEFQKQFVCVVKDKARKMVCSADFPCQHKQMQECSLVNSTCVFGKIV